MWRRLKPAPILAVLCAVIAIVLAITGTGTPNVLAFGLTAVVFAIISREGV